jgi:archaeosine-15-forming tRNA-guanine transglycosylase
MPKNRKQRAIDYIRVVITYNHGETSGNRVFKDRAKAERWAERQRKSKVVKKATLESFIRRPYGRPKKLGLVAMESRTEIGES